MFTTIQSKKLENVSNTCWTVLHKKMMTARNKRDKKQPTLKTDKQTKQIKQKRKSKEMGQSKHFIMTGLIMLIIWNLKYRAKINENQSELPQFWLDSVGRAAPYQDTTYSSHSSVKLLKPSRFVAAAGVSVWCVYFRNITYYSGPNLSGFSALNVFL